MNNFPENSNSNENSQHLTAIDTIGSIRNINIYKYDKNIEDHYDCQNWLQNPKIIASFHS